MRSYVTLLAVAVSTTLTIAGSSCATNPVTGKRELVLLSEAQEIQIGQETALEVERSLGIYEDEELASYVSEIGLRVAGSTERPGLPWQIRIVDSPVVNAFALPGGPVYVTRGILAHMENEAALVGILGHEIGHITARHSVQQISRAQLAGLGMGVGMVFFPEVQPFGNLIETGLGLLFLKFSRDDEREADLLGVRYALLAEYTPVEMAEFFDVLRRLGESSGNYVPSWFSTHPDPEDREARILREMEAKGVSAESLRVGEEELKRRLEGLVYGDDPRQGYMEGSRFKHPDLRFQLDFPNGWKVENTRQAVFAAPADGTASMQLTASRVAPGTSPEAHAAAYFNRIAVERGTGERVRVGRLSAYHAPFRAQTSSGTIYGEGSFLIDGDMGYELLGLTRPDLFNRYRETFVRVLRSYARLDEREALAVRPLRITLYPLPRGMTVRDALVEAGVDEALFSELALVNNRELGDWVEAGTLLKVAKRAAGSPSVPRS